MSAFDTGFFRFVSTSDTSFFRVVTTSDTNFFRVVSAFDTSFFRFVTAFVTIVERIIHHRVDFKVLFGMLSTPHGPRMNELTYVLVEKHLPIPLFLDIAATFF